MEKLMLFLKIIAWVAAVISTLLFFLSCYLTLVYPGSVDELADKFKGIKRSYPVAWWFVVAVISWAFIIAY